MEGVRLVGRIGLPLPVALAAAALAVASAGCRQEKPAMAQREAASPVNPPRQVADAPTDSCAEDAPAPLPIQATHVVARSARLSALQPLTYAAGADPASDRPAHVRAASAVRAFAGGHWIAQDDANFLAIRGADGAVTALALPAAADGRRLFSERDGNKKLKMDLEAAALLPDGRLCAFGSGSRKARTRIVVIDARPPAGPTTRMFEASALYEALAACPAFAGAELNLEGAVVVGSKLRLFNRGNGNDEAKGQVATDASVDIDIAAFQAYLDGVGKRPPLRAVVRYQLGTLGGVRLTFTDVAALPDGRIAFLAAAEASPDAYHDGAVQGCRLGLIDGASVQTFDVRGDDGAVCAIKLEGLELAAATATSLRFWVVADVDDSDKPALMGTLTLDL